MPIFRILLKVVIRMPTNLIRKSLLEAQKSLPKEKRKKSAAETKCRHLAWAVGFVGPRNGAPRCLFGDALLWREPHVKKEPCLPHPIPEAKHTIAPELYLALLLLLNHHLKLDIVPVIGKQASEFFELGPNHRTSQSRSIVR